MPSHFVPWRQSMGVTTGTRALVAPEVLLAAPKGGFQWKPPTPLAGGARHPEPRKKRRRTRFHREKMLESPLLGAAAAATSSKEPPQCLADSDGTGATQVLVVDHYDLRVERVQGFRQELLRQASEMLLFRSVNVYTHVNKHIYRCKKQNRSLGCSEGDVTIPPSAGHAALAAVGRGSAANHLPRRHKPS